MPPPPYTSLLTDLIKVILNAAFFKPSWHYENVKKQEQNKQPGTTGFSPSLRNPALAVYGNKVQKSDQSMYCAPRGARRGCIPPHGVPLSTGHEGRSLTTIKPAQTSPLSRSRWRDRWPDFSRFLDFTPPPHTLTLIV